MRIFEHFPKEKQCIMCGTNTDKEMVLIAIDGTANDGVEEAIPVHLKCAIATRYSKKMGILYRFIGEQS